MKNQMSGLGKSWALLAVLSWLCGAGFLAAAPSTPTTGGNETSSTENASSVPKQNDVPAFDPNTAAVVKKSSEASSALKASQIGSAVKVDAEPGPIQKGVKVGAEPGPISKLNKGTLTQRGAKVAGEPGPISKSSKLTKASRLTKVGINPGLIQKGLKAGVQPGPSQKLNAGTLHQGTGDLSETQQLKLQQTMQNKSRINNSISNVLKKNEDTQKGIVGNVK